MYSLVIIDMQPEFWASKDREIKGPILREISQAIRNNRPVILVEYDDPYCYKEEKRSRTLQYINNALNKYNNRHLVLKKEDDGSVEIINKLKKIRAGRHVRVCGVNTDACVFETVYGLIKRDHKVTVVADACNSEYNQDIGIRMIKKIRIRKKPRPKVIR